MAGRKLESKVEPEHFSTRCRCTRWHCNHGTGCSLCALYFSSIFILRNHGLAGFGCKVSRNSLDVYIMCQLRLIFRGNVFVPQNERFWRCYLLDGCFCPGFCSTEGASRLPRGAALRSQHVMEAPCFRSVFWVMCLFSFQTSAEAAVSFCK